ncbi:MAG TPA: helix-turn-helix transcriptional regulator [Ktedonobacterales bacterium]|nr:helix-turn-helix transcriptional regulator [Ktedonobacterales bacterium]
MPDTGDKRLRGVRLPHLAAWRRYNLLTQGELAERAHVARATINRAERGDSVSLENARQIAEALNTTPQQIMAGIPQGFTEAVGAA